MGENIATNKKAFFDYYIEEKFEAGLVLKGSEVKSLRAGRVNLKDGFIKIIRGEAFVFGVHIGVLDTTHRFYAHEERGSRKLLLHKKQIDKMFKAVEKEGFTLVPLSIYFNDRNIAKMQVAIVKGKKLYDKRDDLKEKSIKRDIERALKGE
jgi:SsrA-binding protein